LGFTHADVNRFVVTDADTISHSYSKYNTFSNTSPNTRAKLDAERHPGTLDRLTRQQPISCARGLPAGPADAEPIRRRHRGGGVSVIHSSDCRRRGASVDDGCGTGIHLVEARRQSNVATQRLKTFQIKKIFTAFAPNAG
jgi:hypothetical protein